MVTESRNIIIGAGLAGLACAVRLKKDFLIFEKEHHCGGLCNTEEESGYRFDRTGHLLHLRPGPVRKAVLNLLDEEPLVIKREARIFYQNNYSHYPFQANLYGLNKEVIAECLTAFIEAQIKIDKNKADPSTFEEFIYRHFGSGIAEHFMIPYNSRLWGVHPRDITSDWCSRFVPKPSIDEVVRGAMGLTQDKMGFNAGFFYPQLGIEALPKAFAKRIKSIQYGQTLKAVDWKARRAHIEGQEYKYQSLVATIPLDRLISCLISPPAKIAKAATSLKCTNLRYLDIALNKPAGTPFHWVYVPEKKYPFYRVGCYSNFSSLMAPEKKSCLYVELASRQRIRLDSLMPKVASGLIEMNLINSPDDIAFVRPRHIVHSYVVYNKTHSESVKLIYDWLEENSILTAGRYARWEYASMEDAIEQGFGVADKIRETN